MQITRDDVSYIAQLSKLKLDELQAEKMQLELSEVLEYMDVLEQVNTDGIEPLSHVFPIKNVFREGVLCDSYDRAVLLENAPAHTESTVVVPKTVE